MTEQNNNQGWAQPEHLGISDLKWFKAEDGKTRRIHLLAPPLNAHVQWVEGMGFVKSLTTYEKTKEGFQRIVKLGADVELLNKDAMILFCAPVIVYDTDKNGAVPKGEVPTFELQLWSFYDRDYKRLFTIKDEWGDEFESKDILVTGVKKGRYINSDFTLSKDSVYVKNAKVKKAVDAEFGSWKYADVNRWMAKEVSEEDLRAHLDGDEQSSGSTKSAK